MERPVDVLPQFIDVPIGAFHRRQAARILAREGFGASSKERDEKILDDQRRKVAVPPPMTSGKFLVCQGSCASLRLQFSSSGSSL